MTDKHAKIVITGAAGLVGQNLIVELKQQGYSQLVAIDKHAHNLAILRELHPDVRAVDADLALLAGDYLYALGLDRLATLGDDRAVAILSELISNCARFHAEDRAASVPALWDEAARSIAA